MKAKKEPKVYYQYAGNSKLVTGIRCEDCGRMCRYTGKENHWHGESISYFFKCEGCNEEYSAESILVDTSA